MSGNVGRPKVARSRKKVQCSVSLPQEVIDDIDVITSRRSLWIQKAISRRFEDESELQSASLKKLLGFATTLKNKSHFTTEEWIIINSIYDRLL